MESICSLELWIHLTGAPLQAHSIADPKWSVTGWCSTPALAPKLFPKLGSTLKEWKSATTEDSPKRVLQVQQAPERKPTHKNTFGNDIRKEEPM